MKTSKFFIPESSKKEFIKKIKNLNIKITKNGFNEIVYNFTGEEKFENIKNYEIKKIGVEVCFSEFFDSWKLIAIINYFEDKKIINKISQDHEINERFFNTKGNCDHCNSNRFRNRTYILEKDGEQKEIGSSCIKDFFKKDEIVNSFRKYIKIIENIEKIIDDLDTKIFYGRYFETKLFLATAINIVSKFGYFSMSKCEEMNDFSKNTALLTEENYKIYSPTKKEIEEAEKIIDYFKNIEYKNEYEFNLKNLASSEKFPVNAKGYVVSMIPAFRKIHETKTSEYVGKINGKINDEVTLVNHYFFENRFNTSAIYIFKDKDDNVFVWKTTRRSEFVDGEVYKIKGTIKEHKEYKGIKQTVLSHVKII